MTREEQKIADGKMRAEIYRLIEETIKINNLNNQIRWYEAVMVSGTTLALIATVKAFL